MQQLDIFIQSLNEFWSQLMSFVPKLLAVIVILFFGWLMAKLAKFAIKRLLEFTNFDTFSQKSGLESYINQGDVSISLSGIISQVVYWLVMTVFIISGANTLGLTEVAALLQQFANYLPHIIVAILVLIFGTLLARFVNRLVFAWLHSIKVASALVISTSAEYGVQILALFVALEQLGVGTQLLHSLFVIIFGAVFLALALAFGLGGREWAAKKIAELDAKGEKKK